jgi:uncharacterized membrane protein YfcA
MLVLVSLLVLLTIVRLVRQKRLDEKYALVWLIAGAVMLIAPVGSNLVDWFSRKLGFAYPPSFVFLIAFLVLCLINLQYSVAISRLTQQNRVLSQKFAILERRLHESEAKQ